jgi:hypothetical protein
VRDPKRIPEILNELKGIWGSVPDLRLGQLILNEFTDAELYYVEDEDLIRHIRRHYSEVKNIETNKSDIQDQE